MPRVACSPKSKFDADGNPDDLVGVDVTGALRIERVFELFGDSKEECLV